MGVDLNVCRRSLWCQSMALREYAMFSLPHTKEPFMSKKIILCAAALGIALLSGCASVPMEPKEKDAAYKMFQAPPQDKAGLYIYRNSLMGQSLKKTVSVDGAVIGETANKTYFYRVLTPGQHTLSTESEFSDNAIPLTALPGKNYYVKQSLKVGVFVGGAKLEVVPESEGQQEVLKCELAR